MTTQDYLDQLESDRSDMVDNLETKGITGLTGDETFTELVPEILNISGGGGATLQSKSVAIVSNGTTNVVPDSGYDGLSDVEISTNVVPVSNIYRVETIAQRNALTGLNSGDMCVVTSSSTGNWQENTSTNVITFPATVTLPNAYSNYYSAYLVGNNVNTPISLDEYSFSISNGWGGDIYFNIEYNSSDGITYTRTRLQCNNTSSWEDYVSGDVVTLPETVSIESWGDPFDSNVGYFMQIMSNTFDGLFVYKNNTWGYAYIGIDTEAVDLFNGKIAYTNSGPITGTLGTTINNNLLKSTYRDICSCVSGYKPTTMYEMFANYTGTDLSIAKLIDTSLVTSMGSAFNSCSYITNLDVSNFITSNVTDMSNMFSECPLLTSLDISNFNTSSVTNMSNMFSGCSDLTTLDISNFTTSNVTDMSNMFNRCPSLTSLDFSNFNTSKLTNMSYMFGQCSGLTSLDLSGFDISKVTRMDYLFYQCSGLLSMDLSSWGTCSSGIQIQNLFAICSNITSIDLSNFEPINTARVNGMFNGCTSLTRLDIRKCDFTNITNSNYYLNMFKDVPNNCLIIVKNTSMKNWIVSKWSNLTNVKTPSEL